MVLDEEVLSERFHLQEAQDYLMLLVGACTVPGLSIVPSSIAPSASCAPFALEEGGRGWFQLHSPPWCEVDARSRYRQNVLREER